MADQFSNNKERSDEGLKGPESAEKAEKHERAERPGAREIKETAEKFIEGVSEVVEGAEVAEFAEGQVGEQIKEGKKKAPGAGVGGAAAKAGLFDISQIVLPTIEVMRTQVALQIKKEIHLLEKEAAKIMSSPGQFSPFKLNGIVAKIRELKELLAHLAFATLETLKSWWLKFVKGITI